MATTTEQIEALKTAIASGQKSVAIGDLNISYRSIDEMFRALEFLQKQSGSSISGQTVFQVAYAEHGSGL